MGGLYLFEVLIRNISKAKRIKGRACTGRWSLPSELVIPACSISLNYPPPSPHMYQPPSSLATPFPSCRLTSGKPPRRLRRWPPPCSWPTLRLRVSVGFFIYKVMALARFVIALLQFIVACGVLLFNNVKVWFWNYIELTLLTSYNICG